MTASGPATFHPLAPVLALGALFVAWKAALLLVAGATPGSGYDSSTGLLARGYGIDARLGARLLEGSDPALRAEAALSAGERLLVALTRWDAIYFTGIAVRGRLLEQEWAWGWAWTEGLRELSRRE